MHLPSSSSGVRDRSFYAKFYSRHPSEIEIIERLPSNCTIRTLSQSPTSPPPDGSSSSVSSWFFSSSDCSSSESTGSSSRRRRTTAPIIQERLNTYESVCIRPSQPPPPPPPPPLILSNPKVRSVIGLSPLSLVNPIVSQPRPVEQSKPLLSSITNEKIPFTSLPISANDNVSNPLEAHKRYLSKSTSLLCHSNENRMPDENKLTSSRNVLDVIQEELSEIRRADHDLKKMFLSIYDKIQTIQQSKATTTTTVHQYKMPRYYHHYHPTERLTRQGAYCCYSSTSDLRRTSCTYYHPRKYVLQSTSLISRNRKNNLRVSSTTTDNDSYVDTDASSSSSDSGTCNSPIEHGPGADG